MRVSVWGWHVFNEIIKNNSRKIFKIETLRQHKEKCMSLLRENKALLEVVEKKDLDKKYGAGHQGVVLQVSQIRFHRLQEWVDRQTENSFLVACDQLNDCQNLGAIIRTCRAFGVNGILVMKAKTASFNGHLVKASAGALESLNVVEVVNLANALEYLNKSGYTIYGLDHRGSVNWNVSPRSVIVLGQEGAGLRALTKKRCNNIIRIQTQEDFSVLNVSVTAGIVISKFLGG